MGAEFKWAGVRWTPSDQAGGKPQRLEGFRRAEEQSEAHDMDATTHEVTTTNRPKLNEDQWMVGMWRIALLEYAEYVAHSTSLWDVKERATSLQCYLVQSQGDFAIQT